MGKNLHKLIVILLMMSSPVFAQNITGKITASVDGSPLPGVSVLVKGTTTGTTTDAGGSYSIAANSGSTLVFSFIGYKTKEIVVSNNSIFDLTLDEDASQLNEVVVTALGIAKEQRALGYATATINNESLVKTASPNFATALYGKAPGVTINATPGGATSGVSVSIRGFSSISGNTQPLLVLDGVPIRNGEARNTDFWGDQRIRGNGLLDLNPADIESISVLKGASAAALYGSEAVNGVLLVTTKSGKGKKGFGVDFSASYNVDKIAYLPRYQNVRGPGYPLNYNDGGQDAAGFIYYDTDGDGTKETRGLLGATVNFGPKFDGQPVMAFDGVIRPYSPSNNSYANLFQNASSSNINLAVSKVNDNSNIRFSFTRQDNGMISYDSKNSKNIANLNSTFNTGKKLKTDIMVNFVNQHTHNRPYKVDRMINNFTGMMNRFESADWYFNKYQTSQGYKYVTAASGNPSLTPDENIKYNGFKSDIADYVWSTRKNTYDEYSNRIIASLTQHWDITPELKLRGRIATDFTSERTEDRQASDRPLAFGYSGSFGMNNNLYNNVFGEALLTYTKKLNADMTVTLMGGYNARKELTTLEGISTNGGLSTENFYDLSASVNNLNGTTTRSRYTRDAYIGTANFDYKNFFFIEGTIRRDQTSTLAKGNNAFVYPSVNTSFVFTDVFNLPSFFSYGKLRGSYGVVGNYPPIYSANVAYQQGSLQVQQQGGQSVLYTYMNSSYGNDKIRPEQKREFEFGLETKFFNNRIGLDISYYNAQIVDQILPLTIASTTGARSILANVGTLRNKGLEVGLNFSPIQGKGLNDFNWDLVLNVAQNANKVEKLANGSPELLHADFDGNAAQLRSVVGRPMGDIFVHGILKNEAGEQVVGPNGLYQLDPNYKLAGNAMPKLTGGLINNFSYKNFSLDVVADFRWGGSIMPTGINWMTSRGLTKESLNAMDTEHGGLTYYQDANGNGVQTTGTVGPAGETVYHDGMLMDGVTTTGEANTNVISQAVYYNNTYNWGGPQYSSSRYELYVKKNNYIKMREISLAYRLPAFIANKIGTQNITVSVFGRNLFFIYRSIKDLDAEQTNASTRWYENVNNAGNNPSFRTMGVMLRASF